MRCLMTFLRNSWDYVKVRGKDTDIKLEVAHLMFHLLAFKENEKIQYLLDALQHPEVHVERDRIGEFFPRLLRLWFVKLYARQDVIIGCFLLLLKF